MPRYMQQRREAVTGSANAPLSYDPKTHEVTAILSKGAPVQRPYGIERLEISDHAIDLSRITQGGVPLLDHHRQDGIDSVLGKITSAWLSNGALLGCLKFAATPQGTKAEGMVARREITSLSVGYKVDDWKISDADGNVIDPEKDRVRWDGDLTFTATRWQLFEVSLVGVPADGASMIRSLGGGRRLTEVEAIKLRMRMRALAAAGMGVPYD
ncbi:hypothetical protein ACVWXM_006295 [Bradyrhizobium sp. GM7.3]